MKKLITTLIFITLASTCFGAFTRSLDNRKTYKNAYRWTGKPKDFLLDWAQEAENRLTGATAIEFTFYSPTDSVPASNEGTLYYDLSESKLKYHNGSSFIAIESGSAGNSLDGAYDVGRTISVDGGSVILTGTNAADNVVLSLIQSDTGTTKGFTITNAGTGNTIDIQGQASSNDIEGTDDSWSISSIGTFTGVIGIWTGDQTWTGSAANILFDATDDELLLEDAAVLSFGDVADITTTFATPHLLIEAAVQDSGIIKIGATNSLDFNIYGNTNTDIASFDAGAGMLILDSYPIALGDGDAILYGDTLGTGDFSVASTSAVLAYTQVVADTGEITYGASGTDIPLKWFAETASDWVYFNADEVEFEDVVLQMMDATQIQFGDGDDFGLHSTTAKQLQFSPAAATDDYEVLMGVDQSGVDLKMFGATTGEYWLWDASADSILPVCGNALYTMTDAEADQFKVDATGTVAGVAINFETTDGKILFNADGGTWGDIELNSADDIILTTAGKLTITNGSEAMTVSGALTVEGTTTLNGTLVGDGATTTVGLRPLLEVYTGADNVLIIAESGTTFTNTGDGDGSLHTLPEASTALGMYFTFSVTAAQTLTVNPKDGTDKIEGLTSAAGDAISSAAVGDSITLMAVQDDIWVVTACNNSNGNADAWVDAN